MQLISLIVALLSSVILCFLPKWLVIGLIVTFIIICAIFLGTSTAWLLFKPEYEKCNQKLFQQLTYELKNDDEPLTITQDCFAKRLLVSRNVDPIIKDIITRILEDHLFTIFKHITNTCDEELELICTRLVNETWIIVSRIRDRLLVIDHVKLLTKDFIDRINKHFIKINNSHTRGISYSLPAHLASIEMERDYLRRVADVILHAFLPRSYLSFNALRHLLREIIAIQVLFRTITLFSDSDYLNRQILRQTHSYQLEKQRKPIKPNASYIYAPNFDEFVQVIEVTYDLDQLIQMKHAVLNEIIKATFIYNLEKNGQLNNMNHNQLASWPYIQRQDLLKRDKPTYIRQLRVSLNLCEKKIQSIRLDNSTVDLSDDTQVISSNKKTSRSGYLPRKKIHPFIVIMSDPTSREIFYYYLKDVVAKSSTNLPDSSVYHLVEFWNLVCQMNRQNNLQASISIAKDILNHPYFISSIRHQIKMPPDVIKSMENFIIGAGNDDAFFRTQTVVFKLLDERYYPKFIKTREYDQLLANKSFPSIDVSNLLQKSRTHRRSQSTVSISSQLSIISDISNTKDDSKKIPDILDEHYRRGQVILNTLRETHRNKSDALAVEKQEIDYEKSSKLIKRLENELNQIENDIYTAEAHLDRTSLWIKNLSSWKAELYSIQPDEHESLTLVITVQTSHISQSCDAWVIARSIHELIHLKKKLMKLKPSLNQILIYRLRSLDNDRLNEQAKKSINTFFNEIFSDQLCLQSEDVFLFFISSPQHLREPLTKPLIKKSFLPLGSLFGINSQSSSSSQVQTDTVSRQSSEENKQLIDDDIELNDDVAEPALSLIATVFDPQGNTSILRQYMITLVQMTYRKSINRQIRETVTWLTSESMVSMYLSKFRDTLWPPKDEPTDAIPTFEDIKGDKLYTLTKMRLVQNIPDRMISFFGEVTAKQGVVKVLESMQQQTLNKALLYELLEVIILSLVPEINQPTNIPSYN